MNKYIPVTDLNEVAELKKKRKCYYLTEFNEYMLSNVDSIKLSTEYFKLNPNYKEPEKSCENCGWGRDENDTCLEPTDRPCPVPKGLWKPKEPEKQRACYRVFTK